MAIQELMLAEDACAAADVLIKKFRRHGSIDGCAHC